MPLTDMYIFELDDNVGRKPITEEPLDEFLIKHLAALPSDGAREHAGFES